MRAKSRPYITSTGGHDGRIDRTVIRATMAYSNDGIMIIDSLIDYLATDQRYIHMRLIWAEIISIKRTFFKIRQLRSRDFRYLATLGQPNQPKWAKGRHWLDAAVCGPLILYRDVSVRSHLSSLDSLPRSATRKWRVKVTGGWRPGWRGVGGTGLVCMISYLDHQLSGNFA